MIKTFTHWKELMKSCAQTMSFKGIDQVYVHFELLQV